MTALLDILRDEDFQAVFKTLSVYNSEGLRGGKFQASFRLPRNNWLFEYGETPEEALEKVARSAHDFLMSGGDTDSPPKSEDDDLF